jgi:hypothetical protein
MFFLLYRSNLSIRARHFYTSLHVEFVPPRKMAKEFGISYGAVKFQQHRASRKARGNYCSIPSSIHDSNWRQSKIVERAKRERPHHTAEEWTMMRRHNRIVRPPK